MPTDSQTPSLPRLSPVEAAETLISRRIARRNLLPFIEATTPGWSPGRLHRGLCDQLDRVVRGEVDRLIVMCPPQMGKSTVSSKRFPAYVLGQNPARDIISASATVQLAEEFGRSVRNCIDSQEYKALFPDVRLADDSQAKGRWHTEQGGSYFAVGVGGALMGRGAELAVIDDPIASWQDGQSQVVRRQVWEWYTGTLLNRVRPGGSIIVIAHRLHEDDLAGRLLAQQAAGGDRWEVVKFPADLSDPPWAERYDSAALERIKGNISPLQWNALYLQNPQPEEGTFFQRAWFWFYDPKEAKGRKYLSSDFAFTENGGDFTEIGIHSVWQEHNETKLYLCVDGWYGQQDQVNWAESYMDLVARHRPIVEFGEGGMTRRASEGLLGRVRRERRAPGGKIEWMPSISDKVARAAPLRAMASMGRVGLPDNDYGHRVLAQLLGFPSGKHDDAVDMVGMMARAIDQAHPAMALTATRKVVTDKWDRAFDSDEGSSWRL